MKICHLYNETNFEELIRNTINVPIKQINVHKYKRVPDEEKEFNGLFVKKQDNLRVINNKEFFQTRISGLISYLGDKTSLIASTRTYDYRKDSNEFTSKKRIRTIQKT